MLKVNELFSGIGAQSAALKRLGIDFEVVGIAEIDKYAIKSYEAIHGPANNYGDISKVDKLDYADFWTYSFPCQDISVAGKQAGIEKGKTRSGLLYEVERLLERSQECNELPKYLMLENVKNLVGKRFKTQFDKWIARLDELGYNTYWKVLNAKNYGIPQNRERVFAISIRKDIDNGYEFPEPFYSGMRLKDILEPEVDEKFYINNQSMSLFAKKLNDTNQEAGIVKSDLDSENYLLPRNNYNQRKVVHTMDGFSRTIMGCGHAGNEPKVLIQGSPYIAASRGRYTDNGSTEQKLEVNKSGNTNTITSVQKDNYVVEPNVLSPKRTEYGKAIRKQYEAVEISESRHNMTEMIPREDGICNTLTTVQKDNYVIEPEFRIRKLTPKECFRLMGFSDEDFRKAEAVNSNSQLYKQAGNSIVVDVLCHMFKNLFKGETL